MSKAELIKRLDDAHRGTLMLVQGFSQEDFDRKAPAAEWSTKDLFAHLALWNKEALSAMEDAGNEAPRTPAYACREVPAEHGTLSLSKVMEEFRNAQHAIVLHIERSKRQDSERISSHVTGVIRHYQTHQNDLSVLVNSLRPH